MAVGRPPRLGTARATPTRIANAAIPARLRGNGHGNGFARARMASALRRCAVLLRLVTHARTPARWRSAQTTTGRRMARGVHCHRSLRKLGSGRRQHLRRRLNAWASMPLTYGPTDLRLRLDSFGRDTDGRRKTLRRPVNSGDPGIASCDRSATRRTSHVCLQVAADWAASKHLGGSRNLVKAGPLANPATRPQGRRHLDPRVWRQARLLRFRPRDPQSRLGMQVRDALRCRRHERARA